MPAIVAYRDAPDRPLCRVILESGEHLRLAFDKTGFSIDALRQDGTTALLFRGDVEAASSFYAAFAPRGEQPSLLWVITALLLSLPSADAVRRAFHDACR